jgi:predicted nucleic-acid-binding Zn-ribbon protein
LIFSGIPKPNPVLRTVHAILGMWRPVLSNPVRRDLRTRTPNVEKRKDLDRRGLICERCHAGQMVEYQRKINSGGREASLTGRRCERCGYTELDNDEDVWSAVGL